MDDARNAPIVSPADTEKFFATGYNALTCEPDSDCEDAAEPRSSITVDVPAVGVTPASQLPSMDRDPRSPGRVAMPFGEAIAALLEFAEPWKALGPQVIDRNGDIVADCWLAPASRAGFPRATEVAERIALCVTFCGNIPNEMIVELLESRARAIQGGAQ